MKILTVFSNKSIKVKVLGSMLILAVCMILTYMIVSITYSYKSIRNSFIESSLQDLSSAQNNADNLLSIIENYSVILATDDAIQAALTYESKPDSTFLSLNEILVRNQINNIIGTFPRIDAVLICDAYGNIYDSGVTVISPEETFKKLTSASGWNATQPAPYHISVIGGSVQPNVISYTCTINNWRSGAPLGYLTIFVDEEFVRDLYTPVKDENANIFLFSYEDKIISSKDSSLLYKEGPVSIRNFNKNTDYITSSENYYIYKEYPALECFFVKELSKRAIQDNIQYMELFMITIGALLIAVTVLMSIFITRHLTHDIFRLYSATQQIKKGNWDIKIECSSKDEIGLLAQSFDSMIQEIKDSTKRLMDEQQLKREYQLELLNQQINPHFLYNTLDNICSLAELGYTDELTSLIHNLSDFYRGVLSKGSHIISLGRELEIAVSYLRIMQTRFYNSFSFQIDVAEELMKNSILRLTLQPILENAICHGFEDHRPGGMIMISSKVKENTLCLFVEDNGVGMAPEQVRELLSETEKSGTKEGFAVKNVHNRLKLYYGPGYGLRVDSTRGVGTRVTISLPLKSV